MAIFLAIFDIKGYFGVFLLNEISGRIKENKFVFFEMIEFLNSIEDWVLATVYL